jgi:hypothetical protein
MAFVPVALLAQLNTGAIVGTLRDTSGHPLGGSAIVVSGAAGFHTVIHSNSDGEFAMTLPYGRYSLSEEAQHHNGSSAVVFVLPLQTVSHRSCDPRIEVDSGHSSRFADPRQLDRLSERTRVPGGLQLAGASPK